MTVRAAAVAILGDATFDTALPEPWISHVAEVTGRPWGEISTQFVWAYDRLGGMDGRPCALSQDANMILAGYNALPGDCYPLTDAPVF